jgi:Tol biopolymer transport system component
MKRTSLLVLLSIPAAACGPSSDSDPDAANIDAAGSIDAPPATIDAALVDAGIDAMDMQPDAGPPGDTMVYYFGDFQTDGVHEHGRWDVANSTGSVLDLMSLTGVSFASRRGSSIALSPDGTTIAVVGLGGANAERIHLYAADGSGAPTALHIAASSTVEIEDLKFSPDGTWLAFQADAEADGERSLYVIPTAGGTAKRVSQPDAPAVSQDVQSYAWAPNSTHIAYVGDEVVDNENGLWTVDVTQASPAPVEIIGDALTTPDLEPANTLGFDSSNRVYFRSDHERANNEFRLYRADLDGSNRVQVTGTALTNGNGEAAVGTFAISAAGDWIAFASESPTAGLYQVYTMDLATTSPGVVSNVTTTLSGVLEGPSFFEDMAWSPDGSKIAVAADWTSDDNFALYVLPSSGAAGGTRLTLPAVANGDVKQVAFTAASDALVFIGDLTINNQDQLHVAKDLSTADQVGSSLIVDGSVSGGDIFGFVLGD